MYIICSLKYIHTLGGQSGCCPKIVPQGGISGSLITADSGYRGDVAIIVDWGTCTAQPAGGFL